LNDLYQALGVRRDATPGEIEAAYHALIQSPELSGNSDAGYGWRTDRAESVERAYQVLSDPDQRADYDATLAAQDELANLPPLPPPPAPPPSRNPIDRLTAGLPRGVRVAVDWVVTIVGAIAIVLAIKAWVVNPYRIPSSSMEPTLHCARPGQGCEARLSDRVLANRFIYHFRDPHRGEIVVFNTPPAAPQ